MASRIWTMPGLPNRLTVDRAVQAALLNNPQVRAELTRLDAAQAELIQAGLLRNPMGSFHGVATRRWRTI